MTRLTLAVMLCVCLGCGGAGGLRSGDLIMPELVNARWKAGQPADIRVRMVAKGPGGSIRKLDHLAPADEWFPVISATFFADKQLLDTKGAFLMVQAPGGVYQSADRVVHVPANATRASVLVSWTMLPPQLDGRREDGPEGVRIDTLRQNLDIEP